MTELKIFALNNITSIQRYYIYERSDNIGFSLEEISIFHIAADCIQVYNNNTTISAFETVYRYTVEN